VTPSGKARARRRERKGRSVRTIPDDSTSRPDPGDVVVIKRSATGTRYHVGLAGAPLQISCGSYDDALERACQFAARVGVRVWYSEDERVFSAVDRAQPVPEAADCDQETTRSLPQPPGANRASRGPRLPGDTPSVVSRKPHGRRNNRDHDRH